MKNKLTITRTGHENLVTLLLNGRIDAYWSSTLDDAVNAEIRGGNYRIFLDFGNVDFLSSAGIRILITSYKELKKINGELKVVNLNNDIRHILDMVGLEMLIGEPVMKKQEAKRAQKGQVEIGHTTYRMENISSESQPELKLYGHPSKMFETKNAADIHHIKLIQPLFGLGLGAISPGAEDALKRMGEFIALGEAVAYLPTEASNAPDYSIKTGRLIPDIHCLYGLFFNESFDHLIHFEHHEIQHTTSLSGLVENIFELTTHKAFVMVMIAETSGLVGVSLTKQVGEKTGEQLFKFPEVRDNMHFTVEPEHARQLAVISGVFTKEKNKPIDAFCKPIAKKSTTCGHAHAAVFGFHPLKKSDVNLNELIRDCFENERLLSIMHLLNDDRESIGIGESQFINGVCWIGTIN